MESEEESCLQNWVTLSQERGRFAFVDSEELIAKSIFNQEGIEVFFESVSCVEESGFCIVIGTIQSGSEKLSLAMQKLASAVGKGDIVYKKLCCDLTKLLGKPVKQEGIRGEHSLF